MSEKEFNAANEWGTRSLVWRVVSVAAAAMLATLVFVVANAQQAGPRRDAALERFVEATAEPVSATSQVLDGDVGYLVSWSIEVPDGAVTSETVETHRPTLGEPTTMWWDSSEGRPWDGSSFGLFGAGQGPIPEPLTHDYWIVSGVAVVVTGILGGVAALATGHVGARIFGGKPRLADTAQLS